MRLTVKVIFPGGEVRDVPAHYESGDMLINPTRFQSLVRTLTPDYMLGWRFVETVDGKWLAMKDYEGRP